MWRPLCVYTHKKILCNTCLLKFASSIILRVLLHVILYLIEVIHLLVKKTDEPCLILKARNRSIFTVKIFYKIALYAIVKLCCTKLFSKCILSHVSLSWNLKQYRITCFCYKGKLILILQNYIIKRWWSFIKNGKLCIFKIVNLLGCHVARRSWPHVPTLNICVLCRLHIS